MSVSLKPNTKKTAKSKAKPKVKKTSKESSLAINKKSSLHESSLHNNSLHKSSLHKNSLSNNSLSNNSLSNKEIFAKSRVKEGAKEITIVIFNLIMLIVTCIFLSELPKIVRISMVLIYLFLCVLIPVVTSKVVTRVLIFLLVSLSLVLILYIILEKTGWLYDLKDFDKIKKFILDSKQWGVLVFLAITIFQVVVLPIPAAVTILIGVAIYGPFWSFVLSTIGTYIGSLISFYLGRTFGKRLVSWMFGEENALKYANFMDEKGRGMFVLMMLFPFFPDDLICMVAGITTMSQKFFIFAMALTRPVMIFTTAFLGSGDIIPFSGWGIPVWIALAVLSFIGMILITKLKKNIRRGGSENLQK